MTDRTRRLALVALALAVVVVVGVLLARASGGDDVAAPSPSPSPTTTPSAEPEPTPSPEPTPTASPEPTGPAEPTGDPTGSPDDVVLDLGGVVGEGLWRPEADVLAELTAALGAPDATEEAGDCLDGTPRRLHRWGDFELTVGLQPIDVSGTVPGLDPPQPPYVSGWTLRGPDPALRTVDGLSVGSTVADLLATYPDAAPVPDGTASWEVFRGDFSNLGVEATSTDPTGTVTTMVSGTVCREA